MRPSDRSRPAHLQILAVSWNFGWPVAAGVVLGHWIDQSLGTSPAATLVLGIGSMAASVWRLVRLARLESEARARDEAESGREIAMKPPARMPPGSSPQAGEAFPPGGPAEAFADEPGDEIDDELAELDEDDLEELLALKEWPDDDEEKR
jgi:F0F1-type ATP synthase assembly protein I